MLLPFLHSMKLGELCLHMVHLWNVERATYFDGHVLRWDAPASYCSYDYHCHESFSSKSPRTINNGSSALIVDSHEPLLIKVLTTGYTFMWLRLSIALLHWLSIDCWLKTPHSLDDPRHFSYSERMQLRYSFLKTSFLMMSTHVFAVHVIDILMTPRQISTDIV